MENNKKTKSIEGVINAYINTYHPLIYIVSNDFVEVDKIISNACINRKIIEYNNFAGIIDFRNKSQQYECSLENFLSSNYDIGFDQETILLLKDVHRYLDDVRIIAALKRIAEERFKCRGNNTTVIIVSSKLAIPFELENHITIIRHELPSLLDVTLIIKSFIEEHHVSVNEERMNDLATHLKGLSNYEIVQILRLMNYHGDLEAGNFSRYIYNEKEQLIKKTGLLELVEANESIGELGGLNELKNWLKRKQRVIENLSEAKTFGVDKPKGIMVLGMPGCGKSLSAKVAANLFGTPLLRLDIGRLLGKYVGESEGNMLKALRIAESMSPCVLWIDEIEKAFSGIGNEDGGSAVTTRLYGQFLTWMQENSALVFIVATANDISSIPIEFLRKGRFDELFFFDLPSDIERKEIIRIQLMKRIVFPKERSLRKLENDYRDFFEHNVYLEYKQRDFLKNKMLKHEDKKALRLILNERSAMIKERKSYLKERKKELNEFITPEILTLTDGFVSAELETAVKSALELAFVDSEEFSEYHLVKSIKDINPISISLRTKFEKLRDKVIEMDIKNASKVRNRVINYNEDDDE